MTSFDPLESVDAETILSGRSGWVDAEGAEVLTRHPLDCVETEFPHFVRSVDAPEEFERPRERHPIFYGCFDWHSSVHSHWCLVRALRLFDDHPAEADVLESVDARFTAGNVEREVERFEDDESFEKPYGWAWFLRLASELHLWDAAVADEWREVLAPLEDRLVALVEDEFLTQDRPFRVGTHHNSAFGLAAVLDYARVTSNDSLESAVGETSRAFYLGDANYPVEYEPLGWDFLSPALVEADLMRRVLGPEEFPAWLDGFLPDVTTSPYDEILDPVDVEGDGGLELHLVGLNLSKAWCLAGIASALDGHRHAEAFERSAGRHAECGLDRAFTEDYAGAHWLSSFVLYLMTRNEGGIAPT